jgi:hypothetical protein
MVKLSTSLLVPLMVIYFAYGSNMDLVQMGNRCTAAQTIGTALLPSYRFLINTHGGATVIPDPDSTVQGLLWKITKADERSLDHYEGVRRRVYKKDFVDVVKSDGGKIRALIYIATDSAPGKPRHGYMEKIIAGAEQCGLPKSYIDQLRPWLSNEPAQ